MPKTESPTLFLPEQLPESSSHSEHEVFDFIRCHPKHALLVLEVKGGGIEFKPATGKWFTIPDGQPPKPSSSTKARILERIGSKLSPISYPTPRTTF
jgi:hypothetical protein